MLKLTDGLYCIRPRYPIYWIKSIIKDTGILFYRIKFLLKHGYAEPFLWESFDCFIQQWQEILYHYRHSRNGTSIILPVPAGTDPNDENFLGKNEKAYDAMLDEMLACLEVMRKDTLFLSPEEREEQNACRARFFELFSEHFYDFWD